MSEYFQRKFLGVAGCANIFLPDHAFAAAVGFCRWRCGGRTHVPAIGDMLYGIAERGQALVHVLSCRGWIVVFCFFVAILNCSCVSPRLISGLCKEAGF